MTLVSVDSWLTWAPSVSQYITLSYLMCLWYLETLADLGITGWSVYQTKLSDVTLVSGDPWLTWAPLVGQYITLSSLM